MNSFLIQDGNFLRNYPITDILIEDYFYLLDIIYFSTDISFTYHSVFILFHIQYVNNPLLFY